MPKKISKAQRNRAIRARAKVTELVNKGVSFNPKGVSQFTRDTAAGNLRSAGQSMRAASIQAGVSGKASAPSRKYR